MGTNQLKLARLVSGGIFAAAAGAALFVTVSIFLGLLAERAIEHPDADESALAMACLENDGCDGPSRLLRLGEALATGNKAERDIARQLTKRALQNDELRPGGWALLAFLDTEDAGRFSPKAADAMRKSLEICPLCENKELLRWRLLFTLQTWEDVPEDIRADVFEGADLLRWWHLDHDFLSEQASLAQQYEIPFDEYRMRVNSPVRPQEVQRQ